MLLLRKAESTLSWVSHCATGEVHQSNVSKISRRQILLSLNLLLFHGFSVNTSERKNWL